MARKKKDEEAEVEGVAEPTGAVEAEQPAEEAAAESVAEAVAEPVAEAAAEPAAEEPVAEAPKKTRTSKKAAEPEPVTPAGPVRGRRKVRQGRVISNKMQQTVVVGIDSIIRHKLYGKIIRRTTKFKAHDETNQCGPGDLVEIMETRPISKEKRWRVSRIVEKAK